MTDRSRQYGAHWEKPEWIYDQVLKIGKTIAQPDMIALKTKSVALFQQSMARQYAEFFSHYTKLFFRAINGSLNGPLLLMLLKQRKKMDNGEISWIDGNQEVIGASFNLLCRNFPEDLKEKVTTTYRELVEEEREEMRKKLEELEIAESELVAPPQRIEVEDNTTPSALETIE